jgi:hypothetical protein
MKAAVKAVRDAGYDVLRVEVDSTGKITVVTGPAEAATSSSTREANEWDA